MVESALVTVGAATSVIGTAAYAYAYVIKPAGFRPMQVLSLCLVQLW